MVAGCAKVLVEQACEIAYSDATPGVKGDAYAKFGKMVESAAARALAIYKKHAEPALALLAHRFRFDCRNAPDRSLPDGMLTKEFFGCLPDNYGFDIITQWKAYVKEWWAKEASDPTGAAHPHPKFYWSSQDNYAYWLSKTCWAELRQCALWWLEMPTSSIAAERAFALGRVIDVPRRGSMTWETFKRELALRICQDDVESLLDDALKTMSNARAVRT